MSRRICMALYDAIVKLRPVWHSDDDKGGAIKVVMTGDASDPLAWQAHIGKRPKARREMLAKRHAEFQHRMASAAFFMARSEPEFYFCLTV